jgi:hypothetical protein
MAGATNRVLKAHGFKAAEIRKIRKGYGMISSAKDAALAARQVGVSVPEKLQARIAAMTPANPTGKRIAANSLKDEVRRLVEQSFGEAVQRTAKEIKSQGELSESSREVKLARKLTDKDARIMQVAQAAMAHFQRTGVADAFANRLSNSEWARAERLMMRL